MNGIFCTLFLNLAAAISAVAAPVTFPGSTTVAPSPSGKFVVVWAEASSDKPHQLLLRVPSGKLHAVANIQRHASVQWSPDGKLFAVTDAFVSDHSRILVYAASEAQGVTSVQLKLPKRVDSLLQLNHHSYVEVTAWTERGLKVVASGYGAESGKEFRQTFLCKVIASATFKCEENNER